MRSAAACAISAAAILVAGAARAEAEGDLSLSQLLEEMSRTPGVEAEFTERKELSLLTQPLESRGRLYFVPPDRLARFTSEPVFTALLVDGERVRFQQGAEEMDLSNNPMATQIVENLIVLWSGDRERLERLYRLDLVSGAEGWQLSLAPRGAPLDRFVEGIVLRGSGPGIEEMVVVDSDGDRTTTRFRSVRVKRPFSGPELERLFGAGRPLDGGAGAP